MIVFPNNGLMPLEAATTFGLNVKLGENPIGFFGTGLKYAIAVCLRLNGTFRLFLGEVEYEFYTKQEDFRGKEFGMIYMRKRHGLLSKWLSEEKLGYTTELGKHWEPWMAVRELESNCRDEGGVSYTYYGGVYPEYMDHLTNIQSSVGPDKTCIVIECPDMEKSYSHETVFLPESELLFENSMVQIFAGQSNYIFYRGLRVTDLAKPSLFTYNFTLGVTLTEDRTSKHPYVDGMNIMETIASQPSNDILKIIMHHDNEEFYEEGLSWDQPYFTPSTNYIATIGYAVHSGGKIPKRMATYYEGLHKEDEVDKWLDVKLKRDHITKLLELEIDEEIRNQLKKAIGEEDMPF